MITEDVQTMIDMMDDVINSKKEAPKKDKKLPQIVQEIIKENKHPGKDFPWCSCNVRAVLKDFVRYLRQYSHDLSALK